MIRVAVVSRTEWLWPLHLAHRAALAPSSCAQSCPGPFILRTKLPWPLPDKVALAPSTCHFFTTTATLIIAFLTFLTFLRNVRNVKLRKKNCGKKTFISRKWLSWPLHLPHRAVLAPSSRAQSCPGPFLLRRERPWPLPLAQRAFLAPSSRAQSCPGPFILRTEWLWLFHLAHRAALAP